MARAKTAYVCMDCGAHSVKWQGQCPDCAAWNTLAQTSVSTAQITRPEGIAPSPLGSLSDDLGIRYPTGFAESADLPEDPIAVRCDIEKAALAGDMRQSVLIRYINRHTTGQRGGPARQVGRLVNLRWASKDYSLNRLIFKDLYELAILVQDCVRRRSPCRHRPFSLLP